MTDEPIPAGKLPAPLLGELLGALPPRPPELLVGPTPGEDACAIALPAGTLVAAADPITLTGSDAGRLAVLVNANDVAVMGARPRWFLATVLLPEGTTEGDVRALFTGLTATLAEVGAVLAGGHTEVTPAVRQTVVSGQMLGVVEADAVVTTAGARPGDVVVQAGRAPVEGAAVLAAEAGDRLSRVDPVLLAGAARASEHPGVSVVGSALVAARLGATAMHDPTEGGLASGLHELAAAAGVGIDVDGGRMLWFEPGLAVCRPLGADPWATLASGALIATFERTAADDAVATLRAEGTDASVIGTVVAGAGVRVDGRDLPWPDRDEVARVLG